MVDGFIEEYTVDKKKPIVDCSEFQAGSNVRSKNKNKKLSETAVFGSTCRHEYPKYFFSLRHGERLGYSVYLLKKLIEEKGDDSNPVHIMYDIACTLDSHLKKHADASLLEKVKFSIPIFHAYGHKMRCQVLYGPRRTPGIGLTDGESLERLWSYLGKFSAITKEMTPENRTDLLTEALMHYGRKIRDRICTSLPGKMEKAVILENSSKNSLHELLEPLSGVSEENVKVWVEEEKQMFASPTIGSHNVDLTTQEEYCMELERLYKIRQVLSSEQLVEDKSYKKLKASVHKTEKRLKICWNESHEEYKSCLSKDKKRKSILLKIQRSVAERHFLLNLIKKYARGQAIAIRLCLQVKIKQMLTGYNEVGLPMKKLPRIV